MIKNVCFLLGVFCVLAFAKAQQNPTSQPIKNDSVKKDTTEYFYIDGDSVSSIELDKVMLLQDLNFDSRYERIRYLLLKRKVLKVWPYAKMAAERLTVLDQRLASLETKNQRKKYSKMVEDYIEDEFKAELKKLTKTEGQILIKLIHRQTGDTAYALLKRLRSGWSAFWFDKTASLFDMSLKEEYLPETVVDDFYVEDILLNHIIDEKLEEQEPAIEFDYFKARSNWKDYERNLPPTYDSIQLAARAQRIKEYKEKKARKERRKRK
ncbi:DUF4294 domain-containing protein [Nonlabens dokdonensis]|uniref:DUF4294 domain-containing protein n=2 Tax=Nonlabens dokdonensis TaxID=328515 RepID=L7WGJ2_NONDD|nr:DUF4294 domain-containing protein [Nonlabens dokdonensis]AGC78053.1 hypothetical protein DDD_2926 [Nonlabens dokdonensis DSW-6]